MEIRHLSLGGEDNLLYCSIARFIKGILRGSLCIAMLGHKMLGENFVCRDCKKLDKSMESQNSVS